MVLEVQDTGKAIPIEVQKRPFDPFFTTKEAGTGLAWRLPRGLWNGMEAFWSSKPSSTTAPFSVWSCPVLRPMKAPAKILLIEDDPSIAAALRQVLSQEGHEVCVEERGDTGLACATQRIFDVLITDLGCRGLGGLELVRELHQAKPRLRIS